MSYNFWAKIESGCPSL